MAEATIGTVTRGSHQQHPHWNQPPFEWVELQHDAFQGSRARQRLVASLAKNHGRSAALALVFEIRVADPACDGPPIRQGEAHRAVRANASLLSVGPGTRL